MSKLDEAIIAAAEAYFQEPCDELDQEIADNLLAACQAFVRAVVAEEKCYWLVMDGCRPVMCFETCDEATEWVQLKYIHMADGGVSLHQVMRRAEILKNAGVD